MIIGSKAKGDVIFCITIVLDRPKVLYVTKSCDCEHVQH